MTANPRSPFCPHDHGPRVVLAIGIHHDIATRYPDVRAKVLGAFLNRYTSAPVYQRLLVAGAPRVDLDGATVSTVTPEEAASAIGRLAASRSFTLRSEHG